MRIIILGATGQIGRVLCQSLSPNYEVIGTSRGASKGLTQFDPFENDWSLLGNCDVLTNCIGQIEATHSCSFHKIHTGLTKIVIENRHKIGNPRIIQVSALGASADHAVEFLRTKGIADCELLAHPDTAVVRPSIVCTHDTMIVRKMSMLRRASRWLGNTLFLPGEFLKTYVQPVMPEDLATVIETLCCLDQAPPTVNVVGPERLSFQNILDLMFVSRKEIYHVVEVPRWFMDVMVHWFIRFIFPKFINDQQYQLLFSDNVGDNENTTRLLNRPPLSVRSFFLTELRHARH